MAKPPAYYRYSSLIFDIGGEIFRDILRTYYVPQHSTLSEFLKAKEETIYKIFGKKVITDDELKLLYPTTGVTDCQYFDLYLLSKLLRNLNPEVGSNNKRWTNPMPDDMSIEADTKRVMTARERILRAGSTKMEESEFEAESKELTKIYLRIVRKLELKRGSQLKHEKVREQIQKICSGQSADSKAGENQTNPDLPAEVLQMDLKTQQLFSKCLKEGSEEHYGLLAMVVGKDGVGKSTLTRRLLGLPIEDMDEYNSTDGIDIHMHSCRVHIEGGKWEPIKNDGRTKSYVERASYAFKDSVQESPKTQEQEQRPQKEVENRSKTTGLRRNKNVKGRTSSKSDTALKMPSTSTADHEQDDCRGGLEHLEQLSREVLSFRQSQLLPEGKYARISVLDFAGQSKYYPTHVTFLSARAIYLLVTDLSALTNEQIQQLRKGFVDNADGKILKNVIDDMKFWMDMINLVSQSNQLHGLKPGQQRVILVATHADAIQDAEKKKIIFNYFKAIRSYFYETPAGDILSDAEFEVDNLQELDPNIEALQNELISLAKKDASWGELVPRKLIAVEYLLDKMKMDGQKVVEVQELAKALAKAVGGIEREELSSLLKFLHKTGEILYLDIEDFRHKIVLDLLWLVNGVKAIVTAHDKPMRYPKISKQWKAFRDTAIISRNTIEFILSKADDTSLHCHKDHLLGLLEKYFVIARMPHSDEPGFRLCTDKDRATISTKDTQTDLSNYLVPSELSVDHETLAIEPKIEEKTNSTPMLSIHTKEHFLPEAAFHRLLAACVAKWEITFQEDQRLVFRNCCRFNFDESRSQKVTILFCDKAVNVYITRYGSKEPDPTVCVGVRTFLHETLCTILATLGVDGENMLEYRVVCPGKCWSAQGCFTLSTLETFRGQEVMCDFHGVTVPSFELLKYWWEQTDVVSQQHAEKSKHNLVIPEAYWQLSPTEQQIAKISKLIGKEYQALGRELGLTQATLEQIDLDQHSTVDKTFNIILKWKQGSDKDKATFLTLEQAMMEVNADRSLLHVIFAEP